MDDPQATTAPAADEDYRAKYLSAAAEVENTKKRMQRRSDDAARAQKKRLLLKFLPVLDNLERALGYRDSGELRDGLAATLRGFEAALQSEGVTPVRTAGERFDPEVAQAIAVQPAPGTDDGTVVAETQRGFRVDDELLRPALVVVAKNA